jgi:hypothetical protein
VIHLKGGDAPDAFVLRGVVCERDAGREIRPPGIMVVREESQTAVPESSEHLNGPVALGVMSHGRSGFHVDCLRKKGQSL